LECIGLTEKIRDSKDPVLGLTADHDYSDFAFVEMDKELSIVCMVPSPEDVGVGQDICTVGYLGTEALSCEEQFIRHVEQLPSAYKESLPKYKTIASSFGGFGKLCACIGESLGHYHQKEGWVESMQQLDKEYIASNENLLTGSSGSVILNLGTKYQVE